MSGKAVEPDLENALDQEKLGPSRTREDSAMSYEPPSFLCCSGS